MIIDLDASAAIEIALKKEIGRYKKYVQGSFF